MTRDNVPAPIRPPASAPSPQQPAAGAGLASPLRGRSLHVQARLNSPVLIL